MRTSLDKNAGVLVAGLADEPALRWAAVDVRAPLREAVDRLDLSPVAAGALGRCIAGAVLLQRMSIKSPSRLVLAISGSGPLSRVMGEVDESGGVRGMVSHPRIEIPVGDPTTLGVSRALGDGLLQVWREARGGNYQSQVEIRDGEIGNAVTRFLEQSEQTRSAVLLGVFAERTGISGAGGLMLEALPGSADEMLRELEGRISAMPSVSKLLAEQGLSGLIERVLGGTGYRVGDRTSVVYRCRCSEESIGRYLSGVDAGDLEELENQSGMVVAECVFCGASYSFRRSDLET